MSEPYKLLYPFCYKNTNEPKQSICKEINILRPNFATIKNLRSSNLGFIRDEINNAVIENLTAKIPDNDLMKEFFANLKSTFEQIKRPQSEEYQKFVVNIIQMLTTPYNNMFMGHALGRQSDKATLMFDVENRCYLTESEISLMDEVDVLAIVEVVKKNYSHKSASAPEYSKWLNANESYRDTLLKSLHFLD